MTDIIIDFETFGQSVNKAAIINCSVLYFGWDRFTGPSPYTFDELLRNTTTFKLDVKAQVDKGYVVEKSSIEFWDKADVEAKKQLRPSPSDLSYEQFCESFLSWVSDVGPVKYWWSRSNTFDPILLWRIFEDVGRINDLQEVLKFWNVRDTRTYIDAKTDFSLPRNNFVPIDKTEWDTKFKAHSSRHDIVGDVLRLQKIKELESK